MKNEDEKYEKELLKSFENGEWRSVTNVKTDIDRYASTAATALLKDKRINIRLSSRDLEDVQTRAAEQGMPYQTLIASVLHKYVNGRLVETPTYQTKRVTASADKVQTS
ncbi:MAG: CopG family antitoxin [Desulfuromonadaceae bacterium]